MLQFLFLPRKEKEPNSKHLTELDTAPVLLRLPSRGPAALGWSAESSASAGCSATPRLQHEAVMRTLISDILIKLQTTKLQNCGKLERILGLG